MKLKNTITLLIVAAGLFAFITFYESKRPNTQINEYLNQHIAIIDANTIDRIVLSNNEGKIELSRHDAAWSMESPVKDGADVALINQLLLDMQDLKVDESFEVDPKNGDKMSLKEFGLETSGVRLKLSGPTAPPEILFGKDTPIVGKMYARLDGTNRVCVISSKIKELLQKKADDFRERRLLEFNVAQVNRLDVKSAAGEIEVLKDSGEWSVNKPLKARGDAQKIVDLIAQTVNTRIDTFIPENGANLASLGLAEPRGSITLSIEGDDKTAVLQIGQPVENDKAKVYAKLSTRESIFILPEKINDVLLIKPNDVRDKHLLTLNLDTVDRIHLDAAGKPQITLARQQEGWVLKNSGNIPANTNMVKNFATYLQGQRIVAFVSDVASDLAKYGLDKPQLKITFSSYASENTAETTAGEVPILALAFGKVEGNMIYARLENEPYVVSIPKNIFEAIPVDPVQWQDLGIFKYSPAEIVSLDIIRDGQAMALQRGEKGAWVMKNAPGALDQTGVQTLVNTLSTLHAVRWSDSSTEGLGLDKPALVISFTTSDKKTTKLIIAPADGYSMWNAQADGHAGAFLVSKPDFEALHADLVQAEAPSATPSPAASPRGGAPAGVQ